jgi:hypothetical protein
VLAAPAPPLDKRTDRSGSSRGGKHVPFGIFDFFGFWILDFRDSELTVFLRVGFETFHPYTFKSING